MRGAGEMIHRATLTNYAVAQEGVYGGLLDGAPSWTATVWAASEPLTRAAHALAGGLTPLATRRLVIDRLSQVSTATRAVIGGVTLEVVEVLDDGRQQQLVCRERAG